MAEDVSIVMTLKDRVSSVLASMTDKTKAFDKSMDDLTRGLKQYDSAQRQTEKELVTLRQRLEAANKAVTDARKEYQKLGDEASKGALDQAIADQERLKQQLKETEGALKANSTAYRDMYNSARNATGGGSGSSGSGLMTMVGAFATSGIGDMIKGLVREGADTLIGSAFGDQAGAVISGALSSAVSGATIGTMIAPGIGTAIGAALGGLTGAASGGLQNYQKRDDAFKSYVQEAVEGQLEEMDTIRTSGSAIAGQREQDQIAFAQRFGSDQAARGYLAQVKAMAANTNYSYDEITGYSKSLLNSYAPEETLGVLQKLSDATAALNLDSSGVGMFISGLSRMRTTNKATQEYLNYFSERGLDVYTALSRSTGADRSQIADMVSKGQISGTDAAQAILDYIGEEFGGLSETLAGTYDAMVDNLADAESNLNAMMGEGYNETRKAGIDAQKDWLESGEMDEAYKAIGAWKASLENAKEQYIRDAVNEAMGSEDYKTAQADGDAAEMGRIIMQAKIRGMNEYNANEGKDEVLDQELSLIQSVREDTALQEEYYNAGLVMGQEFSKGLMATKAGREEALGSVAAAAGLTTTSGSTAEDPTAGLGYTSSNAYGLSRVPYDDFPARLHEGERVLTAAEARNYNGGGGGSVTVSGNTFVVRQDSDIDAIAEALLDKLREADAAGTY